MAAQYESVPYKFDDDELQALGAELARANQQVYDLRAEKSAMSTTISASIKAAEKLAAELTTKRNQGFEYRDVEVISVMDKPKPGLKTVVRTDTGEDLRIVAMTLEEQQSTFSFGEGDEQKLE